MRIVIVEDELKIRTGMAKLISSHTAHRVVGEAKNGKDGLELILRLRPDLVISDIRMPVMDGLEMLGEMEKAGVKCHSVILSGYSEFEYAQKAIRYGVDDYLLKPLAAEDVIGMLDQLQRQLEEEEKRQARTVEGLFRSLLSGDSPAAGQEVLMLKKSGGYGDDIPYYLLAGYLGDASAAYSNYVSEVWRGLAGRYPDSHLAVVTLENARQMFCLFQAGAREEELEQKLQVRLYLNAREQDHPVWALERVEALTADALSTSKQALYELQLCGVRLGYRTLLTRRKAAQVPVGEYEYSKQLEAGMKSAACNGTPEQILKAAGDFKTEVRGMKWEPRYFWHAYSGAIHLLGSTFREINPAAYKAVQNLDMERQVADAVTLFELERCLDQVMQIISEASAAREDIRNYTILRAINYIKEHYQENLSLEQLADYLGMTPEYLSTLFNREVGLNFSVFLKQFRISHAKRLLKGTDRKIYEIAQAVGYHDPKYFNRVFKEVVGVSPGDFRQ